MITENSILEVKAKINTVEVIGEYVKLKKTGHEWTGLCPFHNEKTPSFKIKDGEQFFKCFGCGKSGDAIKFISEFKNISFIEVVKLLAEKYHVQIEDVNPTKTKVKPVSQNLPLTINQYDFFKTRRIAQKTLENFKVCNAMEWMPKAQGRVQTICFNYIRDGELINIKYRAENKDFKLAKDAELIFYNIDSAKGKDYVIIVEGEIDCLSVSQVSPSLAVISVPNGASGGTQRLEYLDNCHEIFEGKTQIILFTDNDAPGINLREELARRLGYERCFKVIYPEGCKDANDILCKFGEDALLNTIKNPVEFPIEGIITMDDIFSDVWNYYHNGYPQGIKVGINGLDDYISFMGGQFTTITGAPGSGKSEFVDYIMTSAAKKHDWKFAICSFENQPVSLHATKLIEKVVGKAYAHRENTYNRINTIELEKASNFISEHFYFININQIEVTLDGILAKAKELVIRKGIKGLLIDPWNYIEHKQGYGQTETQYVSECLTKIKAFCLIHGTHIFLIAHPTKLPKENGKYIVPTLYHISGSAHFFNKTDNGITIYRDFENNLVEAHIQKVRYSWLGKVGKVDFIYDIETRQYKSSQPF